MPSQSQRREADVLSIDVLTIFPELVEPFLAGSLLGQAIRRGRLDVRVTDIRRFYALDDCGTRIRG